MSKKISGSVILS